MDPKAFQRPRCRATATQARHLRIEAADDNEQSQGVDATTLGSRASLRNSAWNSPPMRPPDSRAHGVQHRPPVGGYRALFAASPARAATPGVVAAAAW